MGGRIVLLAALLALLPPAAYAEEESRDCSEADFEIYLGRVRSRFYDNWQAPDYATAISCTVLIKQNFRGEVMYVGVAKCSDDLKIRKSVIDAAYRASPIPLPANKACFRRDIIVKIQSRSIGEGGT